MNAYVYFIFENFIFTLFVLKLIVERIVELAPNRDRLEENGIFIQLVVNFIHLLS